MIEPNILKIIKLGIFFMPGSIVILTNITSNGGINNRIFILIDNAILNINDAIIQRSLIRNRMEIYKNNIAQQSLNKRRTKIE